MAKGRRKRKKYTQGQRSAILAAAAKDGLTAAQVQKRFGVTPVTYYSWRKKTGAAGRRGRTTAVRAAAAVGDLGGQVRVAVQSKIREIMPAIVKSEIGNYINSLFGRGGRGRRRRRGRPRKA
jgi:transposase-like protein